MNDWTFDAAQTGQVSVERMNEILSENDNLQFVDVRRAGEYTSGHAPRTVNLMLSDLPKLTGRLTNLRRLMLFVRAVIVRAPERAFWNARDLRKFTMSRAAPARGSKAGLETEKEAAASAG